MNMNYREKPFYLKDEDIAWVEETLAGLTMKEKVDQIFVDMMWNLSEEELKEQVKEHNFGGYRYSNKPAEQLWMQNNALQQGKIPALIAANIEGGGNGGVDGGTKIGDGIAIAATENKENAYYMGYYGCKEAASIGCNWTFAPVVDIDINWRNCIISNRAFGNDVDTVLDMSLEYMRGAHEAGVATCMKHFPGDGCDERDQHLVTTVNDLSCDEWDDSFGRIYKGMIDAGVPSVMIGHIMQPEYSRALRPGITDAEIMPATIAPELLQDLLRDKLGFNGLVITDATHMVGLTAKKKRSEFIPEAVMSGCDMILYYRNMDEDLSYMYQAIEDGRITMERVDEAVSTILAFKAMLGLHNKQKSNTLMPSKEGLSVIGCDEHIEKAKEVIDNSITLVKNSRNQLPLSPETHKKVVIYPISSGSLLKNPMNQNGIGEVLAEALKAEGFEPTVYKFNPAEFIGPNGLNGKKALGGVSISEFNEAYDAAIVIVKINPFSTTNGRSISWQMPMGPEVPWYSSEVPTIAISAAHPFHLLDLAMVPTYINTYNESAEALKQTVEKIIGKSEFKGVSPVDAFCGMWDTHL